MKKTYLSVVIPFFNEKENLSILHEELLEVLKNIKKPTEIIYVDDGSTDGSTEELLKAIKSKKDHKVKISNIILRKNFGQTAATSAGIDNASGEYVAFLDADLQNDPKNLLVFLKEIEKGKEAVFGWRKDRKDKLIRRILSNLANILINKLFSVPLHDTGCSIRIVKKEFLEDIKMYGEMHRIYPILIYLQGAKTSEIVVDHRPRIHAESKYGYRRIPKLIIDLITQKFLLSYGTKPAYVFGSLGIFSTCLGFLTFLLVTYRKLFLGVYVHRDPLFLITIFLVLLGVQFVLMGLLAELQMRTYFESQDKPIYKVREIKIY